MKKKEVIIVPPSAPKEAEEKLKRWLAENQAIAEKLGSEDLLVDYIRGRDGKDLRQYRVFVVEGEG